jgi:transglutaminase-like putative cysteine protease
MNYKITHTTTYAYAEPVPVCHNQVWLTPREGPHLDCRSHRLTIRPLPAAASKRKDCYGNLVHVFSIQESHRKLAVTATSRVSVTPRDLPDPAGTPDWEQVAADVAEQRDPNWFDVCEFLFDSPNIAHSAELADYARTSCSADRPVLDAVLDLTRRIQADFKYEAGATHVGTRPGEALRLKRGVCQDFAQVQIGCLRSLGLPARYVSGYLRTIPPFGQPRLVGADQSHAWASAYCGPAGWIDVDPTNNLACSTDHIPVAWGRDYSDVAPITGVFLGGGKRQLKVSVDVRPLNGPDDESQTLVKV